MAITNDKPFIFIGGMQRSGTTLLGRLLASHPQVSGLIGTPTNEDEGQFVQDVYLDDHVMGARNGDGRGQVLRWAYHPEAHLTEHDADARPNGANRLLAAWAPYQEKPDAPFYVEKSPSNFMRTRFLQAYFPQSTFVTITRHPIVQGLAARKWGDRFHRLGFGFKDFIDQWLHSMETFERDAGSLDRVMTIKYEDLVVDPVDVLDRIQSLARIPHIEIDATSVRDASERYRSYWHAYRGEGAKLVPLEKPRPRITGRLGQLVEVLHGRVNGKRIHKRLIDLYEERVNAFGYSLDDDMTGSTSNSSRIGG